MDTTEKPELAPKGKMSEKRFYFFALSFVGYVALKNSDWVLSSFLFCCWVFAIPSSDSKNPVFSSFAEPTTLKQRLRNVAIILGVIGLIVAIFNSDNYLPLSWFSHLKRNPGVDEISKGILHHRLVLIISWTLILGSLRVIWIYRVHHPRSKRLDAGSVQ
ncbi:MAG: hypothetical protein JWM68_4241 [Verrucomicrobiales bacterium]|nr:hypothetical protein [Verrucomicrobiales bacterium]